MSAKKQTAVEWLVQQIFGDHTSQWQKEIDQADAMFEQQIMDAHLTGLIHPLEIEATKQAEQYYAETYGKE